MCVVIPAKGVVAKPEIQRLRLLPFDYTQGKLASLAMTYCGFRLPRRPGASGLLAMTAPKISLDRVLG